MSKNTTITTISLPKSMAADLKVLSQEQGRTVSELVREAIRLYQMQQYHRRQSMSWEELRAKLKRISKAGRQIDLDKFLEQDRLSH